MTTAPVAGTRPKTTVSPEALSKTRVAVILGVTVLLALIAYYLIGVDQGMVSVFGKSTVVHEWVHDSRHFLGFPCH
jgi:cobalt transporter subunit CbtB